MIYAYEGKPGEGMQYRNRAAWMSVADFLARQNLHLVLQARARSAAAQALACGSVVQGTQAPSAINFGGYAGAYPSSVPVGNTGTTSTGRDL